MPGPLLVIHLIHGTWGRGVGPVVREELGRPPGPHPVYWFEDGSRFRAEVRRLLAGIDLEFREFLWSGSNSFGARTFAAGALGEYLEPQLERPETQHVLIGHSHAGNVIFETLAQAEDVACGPRLAGVLTLATPYLAIEADTRDFNLLMHLLLPWIVGGYAAGLVVASALLGHPDTAGWLAGAVIAYATGIARLASGSPWRWPRELVFWAAALVSAACAGHAALPWFASSQPAQSFPAIFARAAALPAAIAVALPHLALLLAARGAGSTPRGTYLLRDLVEGLAGVYACGVLLLASAWLVAQPTPGAGWYWTWLGCWPIASLFIAVKQRGDGRPGESILDIWRAEARERERPVLPCELHAMRMAGDEATLVIVASQLVRAVTSSPKKVWDWAMSWPARVVYPLAAAMLAIGAGVGWVQLEGWISGWQRVAVGTVLGAAAMALLPITASLLSMGVLLLLALLSYGLVGLAVGTEMFRLMPAVRVGCESLPRGPSEQMKLTLLWPDPEERKHLALRHSMYDLPAVQERVARWARDVYEKTGSRAATDPLEMLA